MNWCHLTADTEEELHGFACALGLRFAWYQYPKTNYPHYDTVKFSQAIHLGAILVNTRTIVKKAKALRVQILYSKLLEHEIACLQLELAGVRHAVLKGWGAGSVGIEQLLAVIRR